MSHCQRLSGAQLEEGGWDRNLPTRQCISVEALKSWLSLHSAEGKRMLPQTPDRNSSCSVPSTMAGVARDKIFQEPLCKLCEVQLKNSVLGCEIVASRQKSRTGEITGGYSHQ